MSKPRPRRATASKSGLMALSLKDFGLRTRQKGTADSYWLTGTFTKESGSMTRLMARESTSMQRVLLTREDGLKINSRALERRHGLTDPFITESTSEARNTEREYFNGLTAPSMRAIGKITKCMVRESSSGLTEGSTRGSTSMTKSMAMEYIHGQTLECTTAGSITESNMAKEFTGKLMVKKFTVYGRRERKVRFAKAMKSI
jgi:hypothetical protein